MTLVLKKRRGEKMARLLQEELDKMSAESLHDLQTETDPAVIREIRDKIFAHLYHNAQTARPAGTRLEKTGPRKIVLHYKILPYSPVTRSPNLEANGLPWRCDGHPVTFSLEQTRDQLQVYTTRGEYVTSFPVGDDGTVTIKDLPPDIYILYLNGRKLEEFNFAR